MTKISITCEIALSACDLLATEKPDFYESFSADDDVSTFFHAFNFDLQRDRADSNLYYAKSGPCASRSAPGSVIKVSAPDGKKRSPVCGLPHPNGMGIMPDGRSP